MRAQFSLKPHDHNKSVTIDFFLRIAILILMLASMPDGIAQYEVKNDRILAPEVSHFTRPNDAGVDGHGDLNLSVPLMTVPGRDGLDFEMTAQYRSGIRVTQSASWIGLGWELDLGSIARHALGGVQGYKQADFAHALYDDGTDKVEAQPDVYTVNMNGSSILLLSTTKEINPNIPFAPADSEMTGPCSGGNLYSQWFFVTSPWKPWKFCYTTSGPGITDPVTVDGKSTGVGTGGNRRDFSKFIITTEDGTRYVYSGANDGTQNVPTLSHGYFPGLASPYIETSYTFVSTWRLRAILSPNYSGPDVPDATSKGGWIKIVYKTWDRGSGNAEFVETVVDGLGRIVAQITYPYYVETPTHFAFFQTSKRYDRDLTAPVPPIGTMSNGTDENYYNRKLDKITLYKKTEALGTPMAEPLPGGVLNPLNEGIEVMRVLFKYLATGADVLSAYNDNDPNSPHKKMLSKLALERITIKGTAGSQSDSLPTYKFTYYDDVTLSWLNVSVGTYAPLYEYQDDFGYLEIPSFDPNYGGGLPTRGWMWSLKQITYPGGGRHFITYANDSLAAQTLSYKRYTANNGTYSQVNEAFERFEQGGARVQSIATYNGYNDSSPGIINYTYGPGRHSAIPEVYFRKLFGYRDLPLYYLGERGHANVTYDWVKQKATDNSAIKSFYFTGSASHNPEPQIFYVKDVLGGHVALLQGNRNWNWGEKTKVEYLNDANMKTREEIFSWTFRGNYADASPIILATVVPRLVYNSGTPDSLYIHFTHKQLDSIVTNHHFGSKVVTSREAYVYNDGTLLEKRTEISGDSKKRVTENVFAHDLPGSPYSGTTSGMKYKNMRSQIAQTKVTDINSNGYSSTATTWQDVSGKYLPLKEYHWRNSATGVTIPSFNWTTPDTAVWPRRFTFASYDNHSNLTKVYDAYNSPTTITWEEYGSLIDRVVTRPTATDSLVTIYDYDLNTFRLTSLTDPNGQKTEFKYDPLQRLIETINADKRTVATQTYSYSRQGAGSGDNFVTTNPNFVRTVASSHAEHARNHDFETGSTAPDYWTLTTNGSGAIGTWESSGYGGVKSVSADIPTAGASKWVRWKNSTEEKVTPLKRYRMEVWVKTSVGYPNNVAVFKLEFHNAAHSSIVQTVTLPLPNSAAWTKCMLDFITVSTADHLFAATLDFSPSSIQSGKIWYDRANFYELNLSKNFADGLGRDIEAVQFDNDNNRSIQTATYYDFADRVVKASKPFVSADTNFTLTLNASGTTIALDSARIWYGAKHPVYNDPLEYDISATHPYAFSEIEYYPDPLNRVKNQYFPGAAFSKNGPDKKFVKNFYTANSDTELGFALNKVLETRTFDENGTLTEIFTDTFGNKVGVRVDSANSVAADSARLATLFQYDILNNLVKIVPPKAFQNGDNTPSVNNPFCTSMTYNTLGHLTSRKTPDAGIDSMYYDKKGNLRFVKDAKAAAGNYFVYYKYDNLSRKTEEGTMTATGNFKQTNADNPTYPTTGNTWKVKYYYDTSTDPSLRNLKGRLYRIDYTTDRYPAMTGFIFYSYDVNGNVERVDQYVPRSNSNDGNGYFNTKIDYQYDALGKVTKTYYRRTFPPGVSSDAFYTWYDYDALGRLERVFTNTVDVKPLTAHAQYTYWPGGQVKRLVLGNTLQGVDYLYNSRDWLTQINHHSLLRLKDPGNDSTNTTGAYTDRFGEIIGYNKQKFIASDADYTADFVAQFNGNIAWATLNIKDMVSPPGASLSGWLFKYDKANRILKGNWGFNISPTGTNWSASSFYDLTGIKYDRNGNLLNTTRNSQTGSQTNMTYNYTANTNKLHQVAGLNSQAANNYVYDASGNMTKDIAKLGSGSTITYDYRNLPQQVPIGANTISFGYDGKGQRVSKNNLYYIPDLNGRVLAVYDNNGTHLYWNVWGLDLIGQRYWKQ